MTEEGRSYLVMEYVDGHWIDQYCDSYRLDIPSRLKLFQQVCEAVHFAHQHAVIHGDLKPSNILVTGDGILKLTDFGIADTLYPMCDDAENTGIDATGHLTRTSEIVLTPEYASPEQVEGESVTTATDIYVLGIVLYLLLTGRLPYHVETGSTSEILQAICEQVPEKPSQSVVRLTGRWLNSSGDTTTMAVPLLSSKQSTETAAHSMLTPQLLTLGEIAMARGTTPKQLTRILAGDLDAIVLMALHKEPARRYASAAQFADDVHCYLEGLPVAPTQTHRLYCTAEIGPALSGDCRHCIGPGPDNYGRHRRHGDSGWSQSVATVIVPKIPSAKPTRQSISSLLASARSGSLTSQSSSH